MKRVRFIMKKSKIRKGFMKSTATSSLLFGVFLCLIGGMNGYGGQAMEGSTPPEGRFGLFLTLGFLAPRDADFRKIYGSPVFFPAFRAEGRVYNRFSVWAEYSLTSKKTGTIPVIGEKAESSQSSLAFGGGYSGWIDGGLSYQVRAGLCSISYNETALGSEESGNVLGFKIEGSLFYRIKSNFFLEAAAGYSAGSETDGALSVELGGLRAGLGLAWRF